MSAYQVCEIFADHIGDIVELHVHRLWGIASDDPVETPSGSGVLSLADDLIEDIFKGVCLAAHAKTGKLLSTHWLKKPLLAVTWTRRPQWFGAVAAALVGLVEAAIPAAKYSKCDRFGDELGDQVQRMLLQWVAT